MVTGKLLFPRTHTHTHTHTHSASVSLELYGECVVTRSTAQGEAQEPLFWCGNFHLFLRPRTRRFSGPRGNWPVRRQRHSRQRDLSHRRDGACIGACHTGETGEAAGLVTPERLGRQWGLSHRRDWGGSGARHTGETGRQWSPLRRFCARAVYNLQIGGALTRIIYSGVLLSKF